MKKITQSMSAFVLTVVLAAQMVCHAVPMAIDVADTDSETAQAVIMSENEVAFSGEGTEASPYLITNALEFKALSDKIDSGDGTDAFYALTCDIDFDGITLTPIGTKDVPFGGTFDGNGYTMKNFVISDDEYCGIFGYAQNATIKNFYIDDVSVVLTTAPDSVTKSYVGPAVAYANSFKGNSSISGICVNETEINVKGAIKYVYAGNIVGCVNSRSQGVMRIENCYSRSSLTVENENGYAYAGGIAGMLSTDSAGDTVMMYCYSMGTISAKSYNSSQAGGLAGYIWSHGSSYAPDVNLSADAELMNDTDILVRNCFSVASVYSESTKFYSRAGKIGGHMNAYSDCDKTTTLYTNDKSVAITCSEELVVGSAVSLANLKNREYLSSKLGFDFENIWEFDTDGGYDFPVFKDVKYVYDTDKNIDMLEVSTDITLSSGNQCVNISELSFVNGNTLFLERGTYVVGDIVGDCKLLASPNANVIVLGDNKPDGYVELNIGEKSSSDSQRYAEVSGNQYPISEYNNKYGVVTQENLLIEIVEKTDSGTVSSYYHVDSENGSYVKLDLDGFMNTSDKRDIRLSEKVGIRYRADFSKAAKLEKTEYEIIEYGFIISLASGVSEDCQLNFDLENHVSGVAYDKSGTDLIFDDSYDTFAIVTGVLYGIPEAHYKTLLIAKPYAKVKVADDTFILYGEQVAESLYNMAKKHENNTSLTSEQKSMVDSIISISEKA